jgi:type I restriction enzyme S subunit
MGSNFPLNWSISTLNELVEKLIDYRGKTPRKSKTGVRLITAKNIKDGFIQDNKLEYIPDSDYNSWMRRGIPKYGDVLVTTEAPLGEVAQLHVEGKIALAQRIITLRGKQNILDNTYLRYALQSDYCLNQILSRATGTTVQGIKQKELRKINIPLPPLPEQQKIASILSALDDKIELNHQMNRTLEAMAQAIFKSWFVDFEFPNDEGQPYKSSGGEMGYSEELQREIPKGCGVRSIKDLCSSIKYGYTHSASEDFVGPKFLRVKDINKDNWIDWSTVPYCQITEKDYQKYSLLPGDIVVARMADPGKCAIIDSKVNAVFASYLIRLRTKEAFYNYFLYYFMKSKLYTNFIYGAEGGSVQKNLNAKVLTTPKLVVPPNNIVIMFDKIVFAIRKQISINTMEDSNIVQIRDALLPNLLTGVIRVNSIAENRNAQKEAPA